MLNQTAPPTGKNPMQKSLQYFFVLIMLAPFGLALAQAPIAVDNSPSPQSPTQVQPSRDDRSRLEVNNQADVPAPQANPLFMAAHKALLEKTKQGVIDVYFLGDSIRGVGKAPIIRNTKRIGTKTSSAGMPPTSAGAATRRKMYCGDCKMGNWTASIQRSWFS